MKDFKQYLNPIYKDLEEVRDLAQVKPENPVESEEIPHLDRTLDQISDTALRQIILIDVLAEEIAYWEDQIDVLTGDDKSDAVGELNKLLSKMGQLINRTNRYLEIIDAPYFGRILFDREAKEPFTKADIDVYLGKFAFFDDETKTPLITDWRAPIANLYYQNSGPTTGISFVSPLGTQEGDLKLKRQFEMSSGRFLAVYDSKSGNAAADQFLLKQLETRIGKKLKDIVATIQAQQNEVIREEVNKPVIIQGVAGSGKTTIILHRLAYLFFTYPETIRPENSLIIAPNTMFLDYISDVLPSLGVDGLQQNTYLNWAKQFLGWDNKYSFSHEEDDLEVKKLKGSQKYIDLMDIFFEDFEERIFDEMDDYANFEIQLRYEEMKRDYKDMKMSEMLDLSAKYAFAQRQFKRKYAGNYGSELERQQERMKKISTYFEKRTRAYDLYKEVFDRPELFEKAGFTAEETNKIINYSKKILKNNRGMKFYQEDDLAGMVWLHLKIQGNKEEMKEYIVVDEAQDLSIFQMVTLGAIAKKGNITYAGDIAQSIIPPFYISDWNDVRNSLTKVHKYEDVSYHQLFRCYRTTSEIIEYANTIFKGNFPDSYTLPEAVLRHGDEVEEIQMAKPLYESDEKIIMELIQTINSEFNDDAGTVAIICRDPKHADQVYEKLQVHEKEFDRQLFSYTMDDYHSGVLVLPVSRAKGLEFDSVILADVDKEHYPVDDLSVRLLYVAITRTLHKLRIMYSSQKSDLLK